MPYSRTRRRSTTRSGGCSSRSRPTRSSRRSSGAANTIVRYQYSDPDSAITVRLQEGEPGDVDFGESEMEPEVTMTMAAETAHRFWLGQVNVTAGARPRRDQGPGPGGEDPQAGAAGEAGLPPLQGAARGSGPHGPDRWLSRRRGGEGRGVGRDGPGPGGEARCHLRADRDPEPEGRAADPLPRRHQQDQGRARARLLGRLVRRRRARGRRAVRQDGASASDPGQGPHARPRLGGADLQRRVDRARASGSSSSPAGARSSSSRSTSTAATWPPFRPTTTRSRCGSCSAPGSSTGRRRSATRSSSGSPTASSTSPGGSAS